MKPFSIGEYLKNPNRELITRGGRKVRIICTDRKDADYPIVVLISNEFGNGESTLYYTEEGKFYTDSISYLDLFFAPEKHERYISLYKVNGEYQLGTTLLQKEDAETANRILLKQDPTYVTIAKIEWEE